MRQSWTTRESPWEAVEQAAQGFSASGYASTRAAINKPPRGVQIRHRHSDREHRHAKIGTQSGSSPRHGTPQDEPKVAFT